jgi:hypothetical protein
MKNEKCKERCKMFLKILKKGKNCGTVVDHGSAISNIITSSFVQNSFNSKWSA